MMDELRPAAGPVTGGERFASLEPLWSKWWLERYRFGPAEWVWRTLTYGKRQPMR